MTRKATPTVTDTRYTDAFANLVGKKIGVSSTVDGTPGQVGSAGIEIVHIERIYPKLMKAHITYRDSVPDDVTTRSDDVLIMSPMISNSAKFLWLPEGTDHVDPTNKQTFRVPSQTDLTGIVIHINEDKQSGSVLIGYIRMQGEGEIIDTSGITLEGENPIQNLLNNTNFDYIYGDTEVKFDESSVAITTPSFKLNGLDILDTSDMTNIQNEINAKANQSDLATDIGNLSTLVGRYEGISLGDYVDLNTYTTPGLYYQDLNIQALHGSNYPTGHAGTLEVLPGAGTTQRYTVYNTNIVYTRHLYAGNWNRWKPNDVQVDVTNSSTIYKDFALSADNYNESGSYTIDGLAYAYAAGSTGPFIALTFNNDGAAHYNGQNIYTTGGNDPVTSAYTGWGAAVLNPGLTSGHAGSFKFTCKFTANWFGFIQVISQVGARDESTGTFLTATGTHYWLQSAAPTNVHLYIGNTTTGWLGARMVMDSGY